jgi:hypothetical protein
MVTIFTEVFSIKKNLCRRRIMHFSDSVHSIRRLQNVPCEVRIKFLYTIYQGESAIFQQIVPWVNYADIAKRI